MSLKELTVANLLKNASYDNHMIGKWHLGHNKPYSPTYRGFDAYFGLPYSGDMGCIDSSPQGCPLVVLWPATAPWASPRVLSSCVPEQVLPRAR
jgi:hypothetical protein